MHKIMQYQIYINPFLLNSVYYSGNYWRKSEQRFSLTNMFRNSRRHYFISTYVSLLRCWRDYNGTSNILIFIIDYIYIGNPVVRIITTHKIFIFVLFAFHRDVSTNIY